MGVFRDFYCGLMFIHATMVWACPYTCPAGQTQSIEGICCPAPSRHTGYIPERDLKPCDLFPKGYKTSFGYCKDRMKSKCCQVWKELHCPWTMDYRSWHWLVTACPNTTEADGVWCLWDSENRRFVTDF